MASIAASGFSTWLVIVAIGLSLVFLWSSARASPPSTLVDLLQGTVEERVSWGTDDGVRFGRSISVQLSRYYGWTELWMDSSGDIVLSVTNPDQTTSEYLNFGIARLANHSHIARELYETVRRQAAYQG